MPPPAEVAHLVERFQEQREDYLSGRYNEAQLRNDFLNPFFGALGWDVHNKAGRPEAWREVMHEYSMRVRGATQMVDYCFRIGREPIFLVEAKKPAVDIRQEAEPAHQLRSYAWNLKLDVSILTDFEEFAVYDCRVAPAKTDRAGTSRLIYWKCTEFLDQWDRLVELFSPEGIRKGGLDKLVSSKKPRGGTEPVDARFLREIESWRDLLARNLALRNSDLTHGQLNFAVQQTIDRIVFLRICEDRGIEPYGRLAALSNGPNIYRGLRQLFQQADDRYNSGLFYFTEEKGRGEPDRLTLDLNIDDKTLKTIIKGLYEGPYSFAVIPVEILGQVYEQFLGKVIRLTKGHQAKVEEKPEVKKAGGVYYTPKYIVDYIVEHTVGRLLEGGRGKGEGGSEPRGLSPCPITPAQAAKLRILDPACGSGSFLLGAYQYLLDWYLEQYVAHDPERRGRGKNPTLFQDRRGRWRLTGAEKKRILLNNIYGVDIDPQAVEVTKLSLLLKVLEGESEATIEQQLRFAQERALPDLGSNIKCGNSLIGPDFYHDKQMSFLDKEERDRINVFDWHAEFPEVFKGKNGGFDAVIGNPPYVRIQAMTETQPEAVPYFSQHYRSAAKGNYDIYVLFVEKGLSLLNNSGRFGYICPHKFFNAKYGEPLREHLAEGRHLAEVVHFAAGQVFAGATTYTCLLFLSRGCLGEFDVCKVRDMERWRIDGTGAECASVEAKSLTAREWTFSVGSAVPLKEKLDAAGQPLADIASRIFQGFKTGADTVFILRVLEDGRFYSKCLDKAVELDRCYLRPLYKSGEFKRYQLKPSTRVIIFPYSDGTLIEWATIRRKATRTAQYLEECKPTLDARERGRWAGANWYCYSRQQALEVISKPKILTADLNPHANYCLDPDGSACFTGGAAGGYGILVPDNVRSYVLGLLNSRVLDWYLHQVSSTFRGGWFSYECRFISQLPICPIAFSKRREDARHGRVVQLAERMLSLHKELESAKTAYEKTVTERQIEATDRQIDGLIYELYELTDEQIAIVEEATR